MSAFKLQVPDGTTLEDIKEVMKPAIDSLPNRTLLGMEDATFIGRKAVVIEGTGEESGITSNSTQTIFVQDGWAWYFQCERFDNSIEYIRICEDYLASVEVQER